MSCGVEILRDPLASKEKSGKLWEGRGVRDFHHVLHPRAGGLRDCSNPQLKVSYSNFEVVPICSSNAVDVWASQSVLFYLRNQNQNSFMPSGDFLRL